MMSEGEVVGLCGLSEILVDIVSRACWGRACWGWTCWGWTCRSHACGSGLDGCLLRGIRVNFLGLPATDACEPFAIPFMTVNVEAQSHKVAHFEGVLISLVAEEVEMYFFGIGLLCFEHIFLLTPWISCFGCTTLEREFYDNFTFNFHCMIVFLVFVF